MEAVVLAPITDNKNNRSKILPYRTVDRCEDRALPKLDMVKHSRDSSVNKGGFKEAYWFSEINWDLD